MWIFLIVSIGAIQISKCSDSGSVYEYESTEKNEYEQYEAVDGSEEETTVIPTEATEATTESNVQRRYWLVTAKLDTGPRDAAPYDKEEKEKDSNLKSKITTLVEQTLHDTDRKLRSIQRIKDKYKEEDQYKIGFILSLVKKTKDVLNELFNVAVKHRDDYKALEQLKIFEFIVHTNVDTTNLVRQMVEIHIQHVNSTNIIAQKKRVVLL